MRLIHALHRKNGVTANSIRGISFGFAGDRHAEFSCGPPYGCDPVLAPATCSSLNFSNSVGQNGALLYGFSVGGGVDWAITQNIFLRGEFEYVQFAPIANIVASIVSGRVGAGFKF